MAVRTSPAGARSLPGWVRTRRGADPATVHVTIVEPSVVTADAARACCDLLARAGYRRARTNAMAPADAAVLLAAGFTVREELDLLVRPLDELPAATRRARRPRRLAAVLELDRASFGDRRLDRSGLVDALHSTPAARLRVSGPRRAPTGYAVTGVAGPRAYVQRLAVHPDARRRGVALLLLADGLRWARRRGARTAFVNTHPDNAAARALYTSTGFTPLPTGLWVLERTL